MAPSRDSRYDALVVGAGPSGLAAGIRIAQAGCRVVVLDRHYAWGGQNSFYKLGGRRFDVGLHALTNWAPPGARGKPLTRLLRQLRIRHADLRLGEQSFSEIVFPGLRLRFSNDFEELRAGVAAAFPRCADGFDRLVERIRETPIDLAEETPLARSVLAEHLADPLLVDALMLPVCYYGSARRDDCDWDTFTILFRSLFLEGFARPEGGILPMLRLLVRRFESLGGELRMRSGVERILLEGGRATGVELEGGERLAAETVLSSAGWTETLALCDPEPRSVPRPGAEDLAQRLSFMETMSVLDTTPAELGHRATITFFNSTERFRYRRPDGPLDVDSGVVATPNNYAAEEPLPEGLMRTTALADPAFWCDPELPEGEYRAAKAAARDASIAAAAAVVPDFRDRIVFQDAFTPRTIRHYTGHLDGAVYGAVRKCKDGRTGVEGLVLTGTDQGFLGVVGAMMSGVMMANRHVLQKHLAGGIA